MTDHTSPPQIGSLPPWDDIERKHCENDGELSPIEQFIFNNEPSGAFDSDDWRKALHAALQQAFEMGYAAGRAAS